MSVIQMVQQQLLIYFGLEWDGCFRINLETFPEITTG